MTKNDQLKKGETEMSATNKEIVEKVNASFAEGAVEGFLSHCADDVVWTIIGEKTVKGKNAIREWMASMDVEPPKFAINNIIAQGDFVTAAWRYDYERKGWQTPFPTLTATSTVCAMGRLSN